MRDLYKLHIMDLPLNLDAAFSALADPTRRAILTRLAKGEATVMELAAGGTDLVELNADSDKAQLAGAQQQRPAHEHAIPVAGVLSRHEGALPNESGGA